MIRKKIGGLFLFLFCFAASPCFAEPEIAIEDSISQNQQDMLTLEEKIRIYQMARSQGYLVGALASDLITALPIGALRVARKPLSWIGFEAASDEAIQAAARIAIGLPVAKAWTEHASNQMTESISQARKESPEGTTQQ